MKRNYLIAKGEIKNMVQMQEPDFCRIGFKCLN